MLMLLGTCYETNRTQDEWVVCTLLYGETGAQESYYHMRKLSETTGRQMLTHNVLWWHHQESNELLFQPQQNHTQPCLSHLLKIIFPLIYSLSFTDNLKLVDK